MLDDMTTTTTTPTATQTTYRPDPRAVRRAIERRSVGTLATVSPLGRPHAATVLYQCADDALFVSTHSDSRKARNVAATGVAAMTIAVRRLPIGPPATIQFQTTADILANGDADIRRLTTAGQLNRITAHGELELEGACFLRLALPALCGDLRPWDVTVEGDARSPRRGRRGRPSPLTVSTCPRCG